MSKKRALENPLAALRDKKPRGKPTVQNFDGKKAVERETPTTQDPDFSYTPSFLSQSEQTELLANLKKLDWQKVTYEKFGKPRSTPRHTFCFGTPSKDGSSVKVSYKGAEYMTEPIPEWIDKIRAKIQDKIGFDFNAIILNNYINEGEYISYHTDDERFLQHTTVASISLGALRTFKVRRSPHGALCKMKSKKSFTTEDGEEVNPMACASETSVVLQPGSLSVLFQGIEHALPKEKAKASNITSRFNITFRCLKPFREGEKMSGWGNYYHYNRGSAYCINKKEKQEEKKGKKEEDEEEEDDE